MFGVVLWSNNDENSAILWCEDHRDLAVLQHEDMANRSVRFLEAGDLLSFDIVEENGVRRARNPVIVAPGHMPDIKRNLVRVMRKQTDDAALPATRPTTEFGQIVDFPGLTPEIQAHDDCAQCSRTGTGR